MKKRTMTKLIGLLACLCLITSCFVGSTLAKYVVGASASDTARVAKFGVDVTASGSLFSTTYLDSTGSNLPGAGATVTVESSDTAKVVAPGTQNTAGLSFSVSGTPEVDVQVTFAASSTADIMLAATTGGANAGYADLTTGDNATDVFALASEYHPVKFTLNDGSTNVVNGGTLNDVVSYLNTNYGTATYQANQSLATSIPNFTLSWTWDYYVDAATDKADTFLGDLAAGLASAKKTTDNTANPITWTALTDNTDYDLDINLTLTITVTQVD